MRVRRWRLPGGDEVCARRGQPCCPLGVVAVPAAFLSNVLLKGSIFFGTMVLRLHVGKEPPGPVFLHTVQSHPGDPHSVGRLGCTSGIHMSPVPPRPPATAPGPPGTTAVLRIVTGPPPGRGVERPGRGRLSVQPASSCTVWTETNEARAPQPQGDALRFLPARLLCILSLCEWRFGAWRPPQSPRP